MTRKKNFTLRILGAMLAIVMVLFIAPNPYAGEIVAVLAKNDDWVYVEYNTSNGRKRGYMFYSNLDCYNRPSWFSDLYNYNKSGSDWYISGTYNVRSGPSTQYPVIGSVSNETVKYFNIETTGGYNEWHYIEYTVNGSSQKKSGFILPQ